MIWRFRARREFERLAAEGRRVRPIRDHAEPTPSSTIPLSLWCTYLPDPDAQPPRVAFAIGRTVGSAVTRNLLRRRLRAVLTRHSTTSAMPAGWYLFGVRPTAPSAASNSRTVVNELTFDAIDQQCRALLAGARQMTVTASA